MRYLKPLVVMAFVVLTASWALAGQTPGTGIDGTVHDLRLNYPAASNVPERMCVYCHVPHNAYKLSPANNGPGLNVGGGIQAPDEFDYLPLWNHELPLVASTYTPYYPGPGAPTTGPKAPQSVLNGMTIGSVSLLCLSCHDGSIAVNSYGRDPNNTPNPWLPNDAQFAGNTLINNQFVVGKDQYLGNHHPIGFDYDSVQTADIEIRPKTYDMTGAGGGYPATTISDHLYNNKMECATCHSVHNTGNSGEALLWRSDVNSELCVTCHAKAPYTAAPAPPAPPQ